MTAPIVFIDFAGPDDEKLRAFYMNVFGWKFDAEGLVDLHFPSPSIKGSVRKDPAEKCVYLGVPDVTNALASIEAHGGERRHEHPCKAHVKRDSRRRQVEQSGALRH